MFTKFFKKENLLEEEIKDCLRLMKGMKQDSEEYLKQLNVLEKLIKMSKDRRLFSWDTMLNVGWSIVGILIITNHEKLNVLTSKATGWVLKARV